jgi:sugar/nucleoside kinase (ribokinase family)
MVDVYLYGMISASTVHILDDGFVFPHPNQYAEIKQSLPSVGGEAVNSAIMLSKLGMKTKLDGNWLNQNTADKIRTLLEPFGIDISRLTIKQNYGTEEVVITDKNSRTVFGNYARFHAGEKQWNSPQEIDILSAPIVSLDPYFKEESLQVAQMCVRNKKSYVTIDCKYDEFIAQNAAAVVISHELRDQAYRDRNMLEIFQQYLTFCKGLVIFTFGGDELWYARPGQQMKKSKPYDITPIDTTGAGDSFRSGIIYGLLHSWDDESTIDFASAVSACVCLTIPHTLGAPEMDGITAFMKKNKRK